MSQPTHNSTSTVLVVVTDNGATMVFHPLPVVAVVVMDDVGSPREKVVLRTVTSECLVAKSAGTTDLPKNVA